jgi:hypothetical protein
MASLGKPAEHIQQYNNDMIQAARHTQRQLYPHTKNEEELEGWLPPDR